MKQGINRYCTARIQSWERRRRNHRSGD